MYGQPQYLPVVKERPSATSTDNFVRFSVSPLKQRLTLAPWNTVFDSILFCLFAGNCTNPYGKTKFFMEEIMKDVVTANPDWGCQLLR